MYIYIHIQLLRNPKVPYSLCLLYSAFGFMILRWMPSFFLGRGGVKDFKSLKICGGGSLPSTPKNPFIEPYGP